MHREIRGFQPGDERALYDICLRTGASGEDATGMYRDPDLLGHVFAGPYAALAPDLAFVAVDDDGVAGYVLGAAETRAFERACERDWWPALRARYPRDSADQDTNDSWLVRLIHEPMEVEQDVVERYPAHLHIDLLPRLQGHGYGRRLLETLFDALRAAGAPGVHLGVALANTRAIGFYHRMGFTEVRRHPHSLVLAKYL
ncbi:GNAT family N-acetyltransferase [Actinophytocola gossypii]|uniref:GNAT family N-acetyltransferase n=1 Tax=Actinophytocola gossypii TaxID=2812003 RepID=A0ABT2JKJ0_9PSEU|nr:GNAT family N-acetyltransferase [Actinophytocola gossypii]MCT2588236.1 GNAT family N-acetyltransferase [Actinophytocola gossypii]